MPMNRRTKGKSGTEVCYVQARFPSRLLPPPNNRVCDRHSMSIRALTWVVNYSTLLKESNASLIILKKI